MAKNIIPKSMRIKFRLTSENCFAILLALIWTNDTLVDYLRAILLRLPIPYMKSIREYIFSFIFGLAIIFAFPYMSKRINPKVLLGYMAIVVVYLFNLLIFPENQQALEKNLVAFLFKSLPLIFIGVSMDVKKHYQLLYYLSLISVIARFIHLLIDPHNMIKGDMQRSYLMLPHVFMVLTYALEKKGIVNIIVSIIGFFMIIAYGSRGPIFCLLFFIIAYVLFFVKINRHRWLLFALATLSICFVVFYNQIIRFLFSLIERLGMSTRVFDLLISGEILDSVGRNLIQSKLLEAVSQNWFGYGIAADRTIAGSYAHNILIEFWVSFGIFFGSVLFGMIVFLIIKVLLQKRKKYEIGDLMILILVSSSFMKLFLSGSYLTEGLLFFLIGLILTDIERTKNTVTGMGTWQKEEF